MREYLHLSTSASRATNRRDFLALTGMAAAAVTTRAAAKPLGMPIGIQPYTVRDLLKENLEGTIKQLAAIGYEAIEVADPLFGHEPEEVQRVIKSFGMAALSSSCSFPEDDAAWSRRIERAKTIYDVKYIVIMVPHAWTTSMDGWKRAAARLNELGSASQKAGITLAYHNHNFEFKTFDGAVAYDELLRLTDPELVKMELDCFWTTIAGKDPVDYFRKYPGRFPLLHVKDLKKGVQTTLDGPVGQPFTEIGRGVVDYARIFKAAPSGGIKQYYVEQDRWDMPPLESARVSYEYLKKLKI